MNDDPSIALPSNLPQQSNAIHPRHLDVSDNHGELSTLQMMKGLKTIPRSRNLVPPTSEPIHGHLPRGQIIVHDQDVDQPCRRSL
ncbi:MAG TPA: hypothetical protein VF579_07495 [Candidatus Methylomirabilis sp.]